MADHMRKELVIDALDMAVYRHKPLAVVHHSDQGSQYTSIAFGLRCKAAGIRPSMGFAGRLLRQRDVRELQRNARM